MDIETVAMPQIKPRKRWPFVVVAILSGIVYVLSGLIIVAPIALTVKAAHESSDVAIFIWLALLIVIPIVLIVLTIITIIKIFQLSVTGWKPLLVHIAKFAIILSVVTVFSFGLVAPNNRDVRGLEGEGGWSDGFGLPWAISYEGSEKFDAFGGGNNEERQKLALDFYTQCLKKDGVFKGDEHNVNEWSTCYFDIKFSINAFVGNAIYWTLFSVLLGSFIGSLTYNKKLQS